MDHENADMCYLRYAERDISEPRVRRCYTKLISRVNNLTKTTVEELLLAAIAVLMAVFTVAGVLLLLASVLSVIQNGFFETVSTILNWRGLVDGLGHAWRKFPNDLPGIFTVPTFVLTIVFWFKLRN